MASSVSVCLSWAPRLAVLVLTLATAAPTNLRAQALPAPAQAQALSEWRTGRSLYAAGTIVGLMGSGLVVAGIVTGGLYDVQTGSILAMSGSGAHALSFVLSATGLGLQHNAMEALGAPVGRGLFAAGTALGVAGLLSIGTAYFFGATSGYVPDHPQAALWSSVAGSVLTLTGSILYLVDAKRLAVAMRRLGRF
ncbi:MAG: hypothetical protein RMK29_18385 [Myxococcales bacterium]|nr:hypothetical protein [Myxococcota bacterium]MDW8283677.1 hypothetical protein [Myxococcales bacterium]